MMKQIKKLIAFDYLYAWQGFLLSIFVLSIIIFLLPEMKVGFDVGLVLTISTFLFGIIAAFFISERYSRYERVRQNVAKETNGLVSLYSMYKSMDGKRAEEIRIIIDEYIIASMDYELYEYQSKIEKEFSKIQDFVLATKVKNDRENDLFCAILDTLGSLSDARKEMELVGSDIMERGQWWAIDALATTTIFCTILFLDVEILTKLLAVLFSSIIVLILLILRDLDNLRWRKESISIEPFEEVMDSLGLMRYYPEECIVTNRVNLCNSLDYRVGYHQPGEKPDIKVVKAEENN